jgi:hypothetical protein
MRILLQAEPFGFGPVAMIRRIFTELFRTHRTIGFLGIRHTADLFHGVELERLYNFGDYPSNETLVSILKTYDLVVTAMDWRIAGLCVDNGIPVIFLDALGWYWRPIPPIAARLSLYIAQDFVGVREKLSCELSGARTIIVPPMVTTQTPSLEQSFYLLNVGGLSNPYLCDKTIIQFGQLCGSATSGLSELQWHRLGNDLLVEGAGEFGFETVSPEYALDLLSCCRVTVLTGGLGNIFDVASLRTIPSVFLPPFNDSQGQQLQLLQEQGLLDAWVDWHDVGFDPIDYWAYQPSVMRAIATNTEVLASSDVLRAAFIDQVAAAVQRVEKREPRLGRLLEQFGSGGVSAAANAIRTWIATS